VPLRQQRWCTRPSHYGVYKGTGPYDQTPGH